MFYYVYLVGTFLVMHLPIRCSYAIAYAVSSLKWFFSFRDRRYIIRNLGVIFPDKPRGELRRMSRAVFVNFAKYLVDFFRAACVDREFIQSRVSIEHLEYIQEAQALKKGAILLSAHLGNWELGGVVVSRLGYRLSVVALEHKDPRVNEFFVSQRQGCTVIPVGIGIKKCFSCLRKNEALAILGDRRFDSPGIGVKFFGRKALFPQGPALMSVKTGAPLIVCAMFRERGGRFRLVFERPIYPPAGEDDRERARVLVQQYAHILERYVREYPEQWYIFRPVWEAEREERAAVAEAAIAGAGSSGQGEGA